MNTQAGKTARRRLAVLVTAAIGALALSACGLTSTSATVPVAQPSPSSSLLPREVVLPLADIAPFFPELTLETDMGWDPTASGSPVATRSVAFTSADSAKKVTISVDEYANTEDALVGYQKAVQLSRDVPGFASAEVPSMGEQAFAGSVTQDSGTHIGIGVLDGELVVGTTSAGYDATPETIAKLASLTQAALDTANNR